MKLLLTSDECCVRREQRRARPDRRSHASRITRHAAAFTLAEVLAALLFLAIVIPAAIEAIHIASRAGLVAARKGGAARVAEKVLNESLVTGIWSSPQRGTASEGALDYEWSRSSQSWPTDAAMQLVTVEVKYSVQGNEYSVKLNTLARQPSGAPGINLSQ